MNANRFSLMLFYMLCTRLAKTKRDGSPKNSTTRKTPNTRTTRVAHGQKLGDTLFQQCHARSHCLGGDSTTLLLLLLPMIITSCSPAAVAFNTPKGFITTETALPLTTSLLSSPTYSTRQRAPCQILPMPPPTFQATTPPQLGIFPLLHTSLLHSSRLEAGGFHCLPILRRNTTKRWMVIIFKTPRLMEEWRSRTRVSLYFLMRERRERTGRVCLDRVIYSLG